AAHRLHVSLGEGRPLERRRDADHRHLRTRGRQDPAHLSSGTLRRRRIAPQPRPGLEAGARRLRCVRRHDEGPAMSAPVVYAFKWVPPFAQGFVRDLRVRWALEEAGIAYDERLLGGNEHKKAPYRALQPFGQVPAYEEDGLALFESGAIVLHIAERSTALMPASDPGRAQTKSWMFA